MSVQAYETVIVEIEAMIRAKTLGVGDRLEGERALAERLGVSRTSVREAIRVLTALGVIRSAPGSGANAGAQVVARPEMPLTAALRLHVATESFDVSDLVQARVMLETWAYHQIQTPMEPHLDRPRALLARMEHTDEAATFLELDTLLHWEMVSLAGNRLITSFMSSLRAAVKDYTLAGAADLTDWPSVAATLRREHRTIVGALAAGDGARAAQLVEEHIRQYANLTIPSPADLPQSAVEPAGALKPGRGQRPQKG